MLHDELPKQIRPEAICKTAPPEGTRLSGKILLRELPNISEEFADQGETPVCITLIFSRDSEGYCCIEGGISVEVWRKCQRCLEPVQERVETSICVSPVANYNEAGQLPPQYEPLLVHKGSITMAEWIAEELHLALPFVPRHSTECVSYNDNQDER